MFNVQYYNKFILIVSASVR